MSENNGNAGNHDDSSTALEERLTKLLDERLDVEAIAQLVEHLDFSDKLSKKLTDAFRDVRSGISSNSGVLEGIQREIRDLIMDVALLKRALTSLGHVGVMERRRIEKELVRELFPPSQPRQGTGLVISAPRQQPKRVDCESRLHLCKAACCRIFNIGLTPQEVESDRYDWNPRQPYTLHKNRQGCVHLKAGGCSCAIYDKRPNVCQTYSCEKDRRIWADFENMVINPELKKRLDTLEVNTRPPYGITAASNVRNGQDNPTIPDQKMQPIDNKNHGTTHEGVNGLETPSQSNGEARPTTPPRMKVSPPNFDDLRELMVPLPDKKFVPPKK